MFFLQNLKGVSISYDHCVLQTHTSSKRTAHVKQLENRFLVGFSFCKPLIENFPTDYLNFHI